MKITEEYLNNFKGLFPNILQDFKDHDKSCSSLEHLWLGHTGGFSDLWSQAECEECTVAFYYEGLYLTDEWDPIIGEVYSSYYCDCCRRKILEEN